jgi:hypothetical protein
MCEPSIPFLLSLSGVCSGSVCVCEGVIIHYEPWPFEGDFLLDFRPFLSTFGRTAWVGVRLV